MFDRERLDRQQVVFRRPGAPGAHRRGSATRRRKAARHAHPTTPDRRARDPPPRRRTARQSGGDSVEEDVAGSPFSRWRGTAVEREELVVGRQPVDRGRPRLRHSQMAGLRRPVAGRRVRPRQLQHPRGGRPGVRAREWLVPPRRRSPTLARAAPALRPHPYTPAVQRRADSSAAADITSGATAQRRPTGGVPTMLTGITRCA